MLRKVFLIEGLKDRENRELAEKATTALIDEIYRIETPHYVGLDDEDYVCAAYRGWEMRVPKEVQHLFKETMFFICASPPGEQSGYAAYSHSSKFKMDTLSVYLKTAGKQITEDAWARYVEAKNGALLESKFNVIVHEFIHGMDSKRLSDPAYMDNLKYDPEKVVAGDEEERKRYANEPMEFNGIFQQYAQHLDTEIANAGGLQGVGVANAHDMVNYGMKKFPRQWINNLSPELRRHFIKRLTQFYTDMKDKHSS